MIHYLKTWPKFYNRIASGQKTFEVRYNDRDFQAGDTLYLQAFSLESQTYTGDSMYAEVVYVLHGGEFGIEPGYVVMAIKETQNPEQ